MKIAFKPLAIAVIIIILVAAAIMLFKTDQPANLVFSAKACDKSINAFNSSQMGIQEKTWLDDTTLLVRANIGINCGESIKNFGDYRASGNTAPPNYLVLYYKVNPCNLQGVLNTCMDCICAHELSYKISNLPQKDYIITFQQLYT